jgi:hypothetical protein
MNSINPRAELPTRTGLPARFPPLFSAHMRKKEVDFNTLREIMRHNSFEMLCTVCDHVDEDDMHLANRIGSPAYMHTKTPGRKPGKRQKVDVSGFHVDYGDFLGAGA